MMRPNSPALLYYLALERARDSAPDEQQMELVLDLMDQMWRCLSDEDVAYLDSRVIDDTAD